MAEVSFIFDMDGVLIDSEPLYQRSRTLAAAELGYELNSDYYYEHLAGRNLTDCSDTLASHFGPRFPFLQFLDRCLEFVTQIERAEGYPSKTGAHDLLKFLSGFGSCAVASGSRNEHVRRCLNRAGFDGYFDHVVTRDDVKAGKPDPALFLAAATKLGVSPDNCIVFEDSNHGVMAAARAGMEVLMVPDRQPPTEHSKSVALSIIKDLNEAIPLLGALLSEKYDIKV